MKYEFILIFFYIQLILINTNNKNSNKEEKEEEEEDDEIIYTFCPPSPDSYKFENDTEKLYYFSSGLINKSMTMKEMNSNNTSKEFIELINNNYKCGYINKKLLKRYPNQSGLFIGIGLNLAIFQNLSVFKLSSSFENKVKSFFKKNGEEALNIYIEKNQTNISKISFTGPEINHINEQIIKFVLPYIRKIVNPIHHKQRILSPIIASYIQILGHEKEIKAINNNFENLANIINYQIMGSRFSTKIASIFLSLDTINCNHENHIIFITGIIKNNEEKKVLNETIKNLISITNHKYSLIIVNDQKAIKEINLTSKTNITDLYNQIEEKEDLGINLKKAFYIAETIVKEYDYKYTNKKNIVLFVNKNFTDQNKAKYLIDRMKRNGYNILIYSNSSVNLFYLNDSNIVYLENFASFKEYQSSFKSTICYFPFQILLFENKESNNSRTGNLTNLYIDDEKSPHYFKIIPNSNENNTYNITLYIRKNQKNPYFNVFVSKKNPFPDIKDYTVKHYGIGDSNPELHIKTNNTFYISVIGEKLHYDIYISELDNNSSYTKQSNGLFTSYKYDKEIEGMGCYSFKQQPFLNTTLFGLKQEKGIFNILKYCRRGINRYNTIDGDFMNIDLLKYFKMFITTLYIDKKDKDNIILYIGNYFKLNQMSASNLLSKNFSIILLNKLYPIISIDHQNITILNKYLNKENIELLEREIIFLLNLTKQDEMNKIARILSQTSINEISSNLKFLFYLNRFLLKIKSQRLIKLIFQMTRSDIENEKLVKELQLIKNTEINLFNTIIIDIEKKNTFTESPILISFVIGNSLLNSKKFFGFLKKLLSLMKVYISLTTYDLKKRKQFIHNFELFSINDLEMFDYTKYKKDKNVSYSELDFELILKDQKNLFEQYDKGIKKILAIISDVNIIENGTTYYNHLTNIKTIPNINKTDFNLLIMTNKKYSLNEDIFIKQNFSFYENIFYFTDLEKDIDEFLRLIKTLPIKLVCDNQKILSTFEQNQIQYYEIHCDNSSELSLNDSETLIYKSNEYYPNNLSYSLSMEGNYSCEFEKKNLIYFNYNISKYFTLVSQSKNTIIFQFKKQSNDSNNKIRLVIQIIFLIIIILGLIIFTKRGFKTGKVIKKRINNYEE